jgi:chemotaxis protein methyltransferase CheR
MASVVPETAFWQLETYSCPLDNERRPEGLGAHGSPALDLLAALVWRRSGVVIGPDRTYLLETRLQPLLARAGLPGLDALAGRLAQAADDDLATAVVEALTTHETLFFRDVQPFTHLAKIGLPHVAAARPSGVPIRVWSAGSSSGQEAYSIAMAAGEVGAAPALRILGTDMAPGPADRAQAGVYTQYEVQRGLSARRLLQHFEQLENGWRVRSGLRAVCQFGVGNLLNDPAPLGVFDIIFCRNVLIYFDEATKRMVLSALVRQLAPDGWLYLGASDGAAQLCAGLEQAEPGQQIYRAAR